MKHFVKKGIVSVALLPVSLSAQDSTIEADAPAKKIEKIKVTGSHIKRTEVEGVSAVLVLDREVLENSGVADVSEVLRNLSISSNGAYATKVVNDPEVRGHVTRVNLRGLGSQNTLVLLDGRRLPDEGGEGAVDLSTIPMAAIERIEILKDSASAIYGSDATGGVVNIITKKDFNETVVTTRLSTPQGVEGADQTTLSITNGISTQNLRVMTSLSYQKTEPTFWRDRDWTEQGISLYSNPANYLFDLEGAKILQSPYCPEGSAKTQYDGEELCGYNYGATMAFAPKSTDLSIINNIEYDISDTLSVFTSIRAVKSNNVWNMAPNAGDFVIPQSIVQANLNSFGLTEAPSDLTVFYRAEPWGLREWEDEKILIGANAGLNGEINTEWTWEASVGHTESERDTRYTNGFMLKDVLVDAVQSGEFNPFELELSESSQEVVDRSSYNPYEIISTDMQTYNASASGELFELAGGYTGLAVGVQHTAQSYNKELDDMTPTDNVFGVENDQPDGGSRKVSSAFAEMSLPVLDSLELQVAARYDHYSDFGSSTNPRLGFKYQPIERALVRGSVATGFKAPTLKRLYQGRNTGLENLVDTPRHGMDALGDESKLDPEREIITQGNKDLKEETSQFASLGLIVEPVNGLSFSADYWYVKIEDIIDEMDAQDILNAYANGETIDGVVITRVGNSESGAIKSIVVPVLNLGVSEDSGIETVLSYRDQFAGVRTSFTADYSRKFYSKSIPFPGAEQVDTLGDRGEPRWRSSATLTAGLMGHSLLLRNNYIGTQATKTDVGRLPQYYTYDVQYGYDHPWGGSVSVGVLNVFDHGFPRDYTERAGDDTRVQELFSPNGRTIYMNLAQSF